MFAQQAQSAIVGRIDAMTAHGGARPGAGRPRGTGGEGGAGTHLRLALKHGAVLAALYREGNA